MTEIPRRQTLRKYERLHEKTALDFLFQKGNVIHNPPVKLLWSIDKRGIKEPVPEASTPIKVAFSAPKKIFKNAVTRNLIKRRMREAYRKNKIFKTVSNECYNLFFIYTAHKINRYGEIESKIVLTLQHFKTVTDAE